MIDFASLQNFMSLQVLTPFKSMFHKSYHDIKEKYPCVHVGTLKAMRIKDILTKNRFFLPYASVLEYE